MTYAASCFQSKDNFFSRLSTTFFVCVFSQLSRCCGASHYECRVSLSLMRVPFRNSGCRLLCRPVSFRPVPSRPISSHSAPPVSISSHPLLSRPVPYRPIPSRPFPFHPVSSCVQCPVSVGVRIVVSGHRTCLTGPPASCFVSASAVASFFVSRALPREWPPCEPASPRG